MIAKVADPMKQVTDPVLLSALAKQGIDKDYIEFAQDYAPAYVNGKKVKEQSPYAKFYRDLRSNKRFMVVSGLPMVDADGVKIEAGWRVAGINYFSEKNNLFRARVQGTQIEVTIRNDQPDGRKANDKLSYKPQLFLDGIEKTWIQTTLLPVDPLNPNYLENTLEWDYGICKRRLRIIEGSILGSWVFASKPNGQIRIKYNQTGDYRLKLGQFRISDDEEVIKPEDFDELVRIRGYPVTISDTMTFYPQTLPVKEQIDTATVDAFGLLIKTGDDTIIYFFRQGTTHASDKGKIVGQAYTISTDTWGTRWDVFIDPTYDCRGVGGGIIGNHIYLFFSTYDYLASPKVMVEIGYIKSTDLTGTSWSAYTTFPTTQPQYNAQSALVPTDDPNTFLQPWYEMENDASLPHLKTFKTTDGGASWAVGPTIYQGAYMWDEPSIAYLGGGKMICLMRNNTPGYIGQTVSSDNGETWSAPAFTNLGSVTGVEVPWIIYDAAKDRVIAIYSRDVPSPYSIWVSDSDTNTVYADPTSWATPSLVHSWAVLGAGYPSMVKTAASKYFFVYGKAITYPHTDVDTWGGYFYGGSLEAGFDAGASQYDATNHTWAWIRDSAGNLTVDSLELLVAAFWAGTATNTWKNMWRQLLLFNTSALPDNAVISAATLSIRGSTKTDVPNWQPNVNIYSSNPASNLAITATDFSTLGVVAFSTPIAYADWLVDPGWNDFVLNAEGIAAIDKAGVSKFGTRNVNYDVANSPPAWINGADADIRGWDSSIGNGYKPKLVVTYSLPPEIGAPVTPQNLITILSRGVR